MIVLHPLPRVNEEACGATGRVDDALAGSRAYEFHHEIDDVLRGAELTVCVRGTELGEHVFIQIA